jgi:hypothetical protein
VLAPTRRAAAAGGVLLLQPRARARGEAMENNSDAVRPRLLEPLFAAGTAGREGFAAAGGGGGGGGGAPGSLPAKRPRLDDDDERGGGGAGPSYHVPPDSAPPLRQPLRERAFDGAEGDGEDALVNTYEVRATHSLARLRRKAPARTRSSALLTRPWRGAGGQPGEIGVYGRVLGALAAAG